MFMYAERSDRPAQSWLRKGIWRWLTGEEDIFMLEMCSACLQGRKDTMRIKGLAG